MEVWPENYPVVGLFSSLSTQWRTGMSGPSGLDYAILFHELDRMQLDPQAYDAMFSDIRVMESAALTEIHRKRD